MNQDKEDGILLQRVRELGNKSYQQGIYTFTHFLSQGEQEKVIQLKKEMGMVPFHFYGGTTFPERQMGVFGSEELCGYPCVYPLSILLVEPLQAKFADDLTHRDFLGALMNLGIERNTIGDIYVNNNKGYIICEEKMKEIIQEQLCRIKHTSVKVRVMEEIPENMEPVPVEKDVLLASQRLDVLVKGVYGISRSEAVEFILGGKVFINSRMIENVSHMCKEGSVISVRGKGRFIYDGMGNVTKKGKIHGKIRLFQ